MTPRIFLVHAVDVSLAPASSSFKRLWPEANVINLLDESLAADILIDGKVTDRIIDRFAQLGRYCVSAGAHAILFTCSAFGQAIEPLKAQHKIPILTPNEALFEEMLALKGRCALLTTFDPSLQALRDEFFSMAQRAGVSPVVDSFVVQGALDELLAQRNDEHDRLVAQQVNQLGGYDAVALGQFSMANAANHPTIDPAIRILTTPDCAVRKLKGLVKSSAADS
jgi:hypothetical protein